MERCSRLRCSHSAHTLKACAPACLTCTCDSREHQVSIKWASSAHQVWLESCYSINTTVLRVGVEDVSVPLSTTSAPPSRVHYRLKPLKPLMQPFHIPLPGFALD